MDFKIRAKFIALAKGRVGRIIQLKSQELKAEGKYLSGCHIFCLIYYHFELRRHMRNAYAMQDLERVASPRKGNSKNLEGLCSFDDVWRKIHNGMPIKDRPKGLTLYEMLHDRLIHSQALKHNVTDIYLQGPFFADGKTPNPDDTCSFRNLKGYTIYAYEGRCSWKVLMKSL